MKKFKGNILLNTYGHLSWYHLTEDREISFWDVFFNIILFLVILLSLMLK